MSWVEDVLKESQQVFSDRKNFETLWQDVADLFNPSMSNFITQTVPGQRRDREIIDSHGVHATEKFGRSLSSYLTPEGFPWLSLRVVDEKISKNEKVKAYLQNVARMMLEWFHSPASGFYGMADEAYNQIGAFGNAPIFIGENENGMPYFQSIFLGECALQHDKRGFLIGVYRRYQMTAYQIIKDFGMAAAGDAVRKAYEKEPYKKFSCEHIARPRRKGDPFSMGGHKSISVYILADEKRQLRQPGGYHEFPYLSPRWKKASDEHYGRSPAITALGDCKMLQKVVRDTARAHHKSVDPNIIVSDDGSVQPRMNMNPGGLIYAEWTHNGQPKVKVLDTSGNVAHGTAFASELREKIDQHFFLDAFELPPMVTPDGAKNHMSATEFAGRQRQQLQHAGPMLSRLRAEFLHPLIRRTFAILGRKGLIPPPPPELSQTAVVPEYVSPLAVALANHDSDTIMNFLAKIGQIGQVDPRVFLRINPQRTVDTLADADQVPRQILSTDEEYEAIIAQQEEQQALTAQAEQTDIMAGAAEKGAKALQLMESA